MKKRVISMLLAGVMALGMIGCGAGSSDEAKGTKDNEKVTLRYVSWMTSGEDKEFLAKFMEENPDINVEVEALDGTNYDKLLKTRLTSGDAPDVFLIKPEQYDKFVKEDFLMDVSDQPVMETLKESESLDSLYTIDGKKYGFPVCTQGGPLPVFYNVKYFEKLGIVQPTTLDELWAASEKIKADGVEPFVFGDKDAWTFEMFFRGRHFGNYLSENPEWGQALYNGDVKSSEMFKQEFEMAEMMVKNGYIGKSSLTMTYPQSVTYFVEGKAAMLPQGTWVPGLDEIKNADPEKFELGCFMVPVDEVNGKIYTTGTSDRSIVISSATKYLEEAKKLFDWFAKEENLSEYLSSQSLTTFLPIEYEVDPVIKDYVTALTTDKFEIIMSQKATMPAGFTSMMEKGLQSILAGSPATDELQKLDTEFEKFKSSIVVAE
ncbi:MAG: ABC transporter substrate-binding protein [Hespellia sp.]|nr:ABC transporter substrate-binding protein [Hespellia sp.]